jgi:spore germination protein
VKIKSNGKLEEPFFEINLRLKGNVLEYHGPIDLENDEGINELEELISKEIKEQAGNVLEIFKEYKVDPILLGEHMRIYYSKDEWTSKKWEEALPKIEYNINVITEIKNSGTIK